MVVMDNMGAHHNPDVSCLIQKAGTNECDLPPYSPDLNPTGKLWFKIKAYLRKVRAPTFDSLMISGRWNGDSGAGAALFSSVRRNRLIG